MFRVFNHDRALSEHALNEAVYQDTAGVIWDSIKQSLEEFRLLK